MRDERGATLVEMAVVMTILGLVIAIAMNSLLSVLRTSASVEDRTVTVADARLALDQIAGELRGANPIAAPTSPNAARTSVTLTEYCGTPNVADCTASSTRIITYALASNAVTRTTSAGSRPILGPVGVSAVATVSQRDAVVNTSTQPLFDYLDKNGNALGTSVGSVVPVNSFRDCVEQVRIHLVVNAEAARSSTVDVSTTVRLRNYTLVSGC